MPNHVTNILQLEGDRFRVREMMEKIKNDGYGVGTIDFNKILPMPKELEIESSSRTHHGLEIYKDFVEVYLLGRSPEDARNALKDIPITSEEAFLKQRNDISPEEWELGKAAWKNLRDYGSATWYEWSNGNWGTKWNAYGYDDPNADYGSEDSVWFQTAWGAPHPVIQKLAEMFPDVQIVHDWADEDIGSNCGRYKYCGGVRVDEYFPLTSVEAISFAAGVMDSDPADWGLYLNATGDDYISCWDEKFQVGEMFGKPALFTRGEIRNNDIPQGLHCYHFRLSDDGKSLQTIEPIVTVNYGGAVIMADRIEFGDNGYKVLTKDDMPIFNEGEKQTLDQFLYEHDAAENCDLEGGMVQL